MEESSFTSTSSTTSSSSSSSVGPSVAIIGIGECPVECQTAEEATTKIQCKDVEDDGDDIEIADDNDDDNLSVISVVCTSSNTKESF